jgi:hypothetical protein
MSTLHRFILLPDYRARLVAMFPRVTAAQLMRFDDLVRSDRIIGDDGEPHPDLMAWVAAVIRPGDDPEPVPSPASGPSPSPAGQVIAEVRA